MLLIYNPQSTTRLQYIFKFIFDEVLGTTYSITTDEDNFKNNTGSKINYSDHSIKEVFQIKPHTLLFESNIQPQAVNVSFKTGQPIFFTSEDADYPFDIFSAAFYLISRYEEYLLYTEDMYGRFAHENSLAFQNNFLHLPLVNVWLEDFKLKLLQLFPSLLFEPKAFSFVPTYDIDIAWSYKEKGLLRNIGGFLKRPSVDRIATLLGNKKDPFDCYDFLYDTHSKFHLRPLYFFLVAKENGLYDKNILPHNKAMQLLIKQHAAQYKIGLHPSWRSFNNEAVISQEKKNIENISGKEINISRQHYIKLKLPKTYQQLSALGFTDDYSMGYGSINGFRASTASPFFWYDLALDKMTTLRIHPFCFMDANCFYEQKLNVQESADELMKYHRICKDVHAPLVTIFHNNFLGTENMFVGWKELYIRFISQLQQ